MKAVSLDAGAALLTIRNMELKNIFPVYYKESTRLGTEAFQPEQGKTSFLPQFLPQEADGREEGWSRKMGKASPDVTTAGESRVRAAEKIRTEGLSCRGQRIQKPRPSGLGDSGSQEEFQGGVWVGIVWKDRLGWWQNPGSEERTDWSKEGGAEA